MLDHPHRAVLPVVGEGHEVRAVSQHRLDAEGHQLRMHEVVGIEEKQVLAPHVLHPHVACLGLSAVCFMNDAEAVVALRVFLGDASAAVCAAVVHQDGFPLLVCLRENAVESPAQVRLGVVDGYYDGNHDAFVFILSARTYTSGCATRAISRADGKCSARACARSIAREGSG